MKYSDKNKPLVCMMTNSSCYKGTRVMDVKGVLWHSTGVNNPTLKRYVQPDDKASNRAELLKLIGTNNNKNDWNHTAVDAGLNAWIGKLADGTITTVQTMPWTYRPWGCGGGTKGSCNSGWIQFEICEDGLNDKTYFNKVYKEACELTAYLCKLYKLDPYGTVTMNGVKIPVILCHADSNKLGFGSAHADVYHWFNKYGVSMETVRKDVAALLNATSGNINPQPRTLSQGMNGADVAEMQLKLMKLSYSCGADGNDGYFGPLTTKAVKAFQKDKKLAVDGYCGPLTQAALKTAVESLGKQTYRIRKTWADKASQRGAYSILENALTACKAIGQGFSVYSPQGTLLFTAVTAQITPVVHVIKTVNYRVQITADSLRYRSGPGTSYAINGTLKKNQVYTIVQEDGEWGKLKSGAGWINLNYTKKV